MSIPVSGRALSIDAAFAFALSVFSVGMFILLTTNDQLDLSNPYVVLGVGIVFLTIIGADFIIWSDARAYLRHKSKLRDEEILFLRGQLDDAEAEAVEWKGKYERFGDVYRTDLAAARRRAFFGELNRQRTATNCVLALLVIAAILWRRRR